MKVLSQSDYRRQKYLVNWFVETILPLIFFVIIIGLVCFAVLSSTWFDHKNFSSVPQGEITVLKDNKITFLPKGAIIIGEVHEYISDEDVTLDQKLPENQPLKAETLVKTYGEVVIYWSLDQQETAQNMLDN